MRVVCVQIVKAGLLDAWGRSSGHVHMGRGYWTHGGFIFECGRMYGRVRRRGGM